MILQLDSRVSDCIACRDVYFYLQLASGRNSRMPITLSRDIRWKNCRPVSQLLFTTSLRYRTILSFPRSKMRVTAITWMSGLKHTMKSERQTSDAVRNLGGAACVLARQVKT